MKTTFSVDNIRIASPCHARWNDMDGDERARFCGRCSRHVFNLSALTRAEIETLVREKEGKFCGRFYRRADGRMLTADCPSRLRLLQERVTKWGGALCALMLSWIGCSSRPTNSTRGEPGQVLMGDVIGTPVVSATNPLPEIMGKISLPPPPPVPETDSRVLMGEISVVPANPAPPEK